MEKKSIANKFNLIVNFYNKNNPIFTEEYFKEISKTIY